MAMRDINDGKSVSEKPNPKQSTIAIYKTQTKTQEKTQKKKRMSLQPQLMQGGWEETPSV